MVFTCISGGADPAGPAGVPMSIPPTLCAHRSPGDLVEIQTQIQEVCVSGPTSISVSTAGDPEVAGLGTTLGQARMQSRGWQTATYVLRPSACSCRQRHWDVAMRTDVTLPVCASTGRQSGGVVAEARWPTDSAWRLFGKRSAHP